jgi:hypothetical protein
MTVIAESHMARDLGFTGLPSCNPASLWILEREAPRSLGCYHGRRANVRGNAVHSQVGLGSSCDDRACLHQVSL